MNAKNLPERNRSAGRIGIAAAVVLLSLAACAALIVLLLPRRPAASPPSLLVYCAAGIKPPVEQAALRYEQETGVKVLLQYGGSGTLLSNLRVAKTGDLFVAGDESYVRMGREQGLLGDSVSLARLRPVIAVRRGNPRGVKAVADLLRDDVVVALANPEAASIGKLTQKLLEPGGTWAALKPRVKVFKPTVTDIANDIKLGAVDAGIVWDATVRQYPELESVAAEPLASASETVTVAVLAAGRQPEAARRFVRYLAAPDRGGEAFTAHHYEAIPGETWTKKQEKP